MAAPMHLEPVARSPRPEVMPLPVTATTAPGRPFDVLIQLGQRFSVGPKHLIAPAPSEAQLQQAAALALRAPDHGGLGPFRFVRVDADQRPALATLFASDAARRGHGVDEVERARARAHNGPALVALVGHVREGMDAVPPHEQWISIGAGLMNFLNALHLLGFAAKTLSGASVADPDIRKAFCGEGETLIAWIVAGTPARVSGPKHVRAPEAVMSRWCGDTGSIPHRI